MAAGRRAPFVGILGPFCQPFQADVESRINKGPV
jgi:hypothetical protein